MLNAAVRTCSVRNFPHFERQLSSRLYIPVEFNFHTWPPPYLLDEWIRRTITTLRFFLQFLALFSSRLSNVYSSFVHCNSWINLCTEKLENERKINKEINQDLLDLSHIILILIHCVLLYKFKLCLKY